MNNADLNKPEAVKDFIVGRDCSTAFRECLIESYDYYCQYAGSKWNKSFYKRHEQLPKLHTEEQIDMLIAGAKKLSLVLCLMKDSGCRPIELTWLKVRDFDLNNNLVTINTAKHGKGRMLKQTTGARIHIIASTMDSRNHFLLLEG